MIIGKTPLGENQKRPTSESRLTASISKSNHAFFRFPLGILLLAGVLDGDLLQDMSRPAS